jgi:hypothetical protein
MRPKRRGEVRDLVWANRKKWTQITHIRVTQFYLTDKKILVRKNGYFQGSFHT